MTMLFDFFKKKAVVTKTDEKFKPLTGSAVSDWSILMTSWLTLTTKEQYAKFAKDQADKKLKNTKKFYVGKNAETLTEWMLAEEKKGNVGKGLLSNHRLVKCKYEGWYTDESPV
jgi:hypothetical protein